METRIPRDKVIERLREAAKETDHAIAHAVADYLLLAYINDPEIERLYTAIKRFFG